MVQKTGAPHVRILSGKDGIDPDCAKNVTIEDCLIMSKDDSIAVKTRKPPATTERITVRNCIVASDASALKVGTETRALIKDILFENCEVFDSDRGIVMYARDGGPIENVTWRNIHMSLVHWPHETGGRPFTFEITERGGITPVRNCLVENIVTNTIVSSSLSGLPEAVLDGVTFHNVAINVETPHMGSSGKKPYLFWVGHHVDTRIHGLKIDWQDNEPLWTGVSSGPGLQIHNVQE